MQIANILDRIDNNQIYIPAFQREYVWKKEDAKELLDSLIKEYPFGSMLTWETSNPPHLKGRHMYDPMQGTIKVILDGQQRITTLYMVIRGKIAPYYENEMEMAEENLFINIENLEMSYHRTVTRQNNPLLLRMTDIFQDKIHTFEYEDKYETINQKEIPRDLRIKCSKNFQKIKNILNREFPEQIIPNHADTSDAINIFYKVNSGGIKLTEAELALAQISGYWPEARDKFKEKIDTLALQGFELRLDHLVYALLGCIYHSGSEMKKLHSTDNLEKIKEVWEELNNNILDYVFNLLKREAHVEHRKEINSIYAIIPLIVLKYSDGPSNQWNEEKIKKAIKWFYYSQIRNRYVYGLPAKLDYDLNILKYSDQPFDDLLSVIEEDRILKITPDEFEYAGIGSPLWSMMKWYFKSKNAKCLTTGVSILGHNIGKKYQLEKDHIFPKSKLKGLDNGSNTKKYNQQINEITNLAFLTQLGNRKKSDQPAKDYLKEVKENFPDALSLQLIPDDEGLWNIENFQEFLRTRRKILADQINHFIENISDHDPSNMSLSLNDLIDDGESQEIEFKQTFCWDIHQNIQNNDRQFDIFKCIAAFGNSKDGGKLLIGVSDDKEIMGLDLDYQYFKNRDKFESYLRDKIESNFNKTFLATKISIAFEIIQGKEICIVDVKPILNEDDLLFLKKNNQQILYVRSGNSSRIIPQNEQTKFIRERF